MILAQGVERSLTGATVVGLEFTRQPRPGGGARRSRGGRLFVELAETDRQIGFKLRDRRQASFEESPRFRAFVEARAQVVEFATRAGQLLTGSGEGRARAFRVRFETGYFGADTFSPLAKFLLLR